MTNRLVTWIIQFGPVVMTVTFGGLAAIPGVRESLGISVDDAVLLVLVLLATAQLSDRFTVLRSTEARLQQVQKDAALLHEQLTQVYQLAKKQVRARDFFTEEILDTNPQARIEACETISISGIHLLRTTHTLWPVLRDRLTAGAKARILLLDPDDRAAIIATSFRFERHQIPSRLRQEVRVALSNWKSLGERVPSGTLEIRLLRVMPPFGIWLIDDGTERAEMMVEVYAFRGNEPTFRLNPHQDPQWYAFFQHQFESMWENGRVWFPPAPQESSAASTTPS